MSTSGNDVSSSGTTSESKTSDTSLNASTVESSVYPSSSSSANPSIDHTTSSSGQSSSGQQSVPSSNGDGQSKDQQDTQSHSQSRDDKESSDGADGNKDSSTNDTDTTIAKPLPSVDDKSAPMEEDLTPSLMVIDLTQSQHETSETPMDTSTSPDILRTSTDNVEKRNMLLDAVKSPFVLENECQIESENHDPSDIGTQNSFCLKLSPSQVGNLQSQITVDLSPGNSKNVQEGHIIEANTVTKASSTSNTGLASDVPATTLNKTDSASPIGVIRLSQLAAEVRGPLYESLALNSSSESLLDSSRHSDNTITVNREASSGHSTQKSTPLGTPSGIITVPCLSVDI